MPLKNKDLHIVISYRIRVVNIVLRLATLGSRFLFIFFLARFLDPAQLGLYGLVTATIGYSLYLLGFDFYTFTTREVLKRDRQEWGGLLKNQAALSLLLYGIIIPLLSLIFINKLLPWQLAGWFFALLIIEHLNQEIGRFLIAISQQLWASVLLFFRQGSWAIAVIALMTLEPSTRSLDSVFFAWTVAGLIAVLLGIVRIAKLDIGGWQKKIDWHWIFAGLKVSIPFLFATLALRGVFTLDRYWLQSLGGLDIVGAYVLFIGIAGTLMTFLDAGVFAFSYPALIGAHHRQEPNVFRKNMRALLLHTIVLSFGFAVISLLLLSPLLAWLANPIYTQTKYLYPWLLIAMIINALGMVPHYALYAQGVDTPIIHSHLASLVVFIGATWALAAHWPLLAVPLGVCFSVGIIFVWKLWLFFKASPRQYYSAKC